MTEILLIKSNFVGCKYNAENINTFYYGFMYVTTKQRCRIKLLIGNYERLNEKYYGEAVRSVYAF